MTKQTKSFIMGVTGWILLSLSLHGQPAISTSERMLEQEDRLTLGGYGQIDFNQPVSGGIYQNGTLDVHRLVFMLGYKFSEKVQFISEVELEHVEEIFVEQAFMQVELLPWLKFRGGLVLIPMGIMNEYHEPPTFNGVERPNLDKFIVPTTWREIGLGFTGAFPSAGLSYQVYLINGFNGYDGTARLTGKNGFRSGRQKGAGSYISTPNLAWKLSYFGIPGLQLGISAYSGKSQSTLYDGLEKNDLPGHAVADSSVVGLTMLGADARYELAGIRFRGQVNYGWISGSEAYNSFTGSDLGSAMGGGYVEVAYNIFRKMERIQSELIPFIRFEQYNTHASVAGELEKESAYNRRELTFGMGLKLNRGAMLKMDYQLFRKVGNPSNTGQLNAGVAVWF